MANFIPFGEPGLFDEFMQNLDVAAFKTPLLRVGKIVRWEQFEPELHAAVLPAPPKGPGGRPRLAPLLMFKVLVLQSLPGLADDAVSYQITDRHSFRAFLGLTPGDAVPDGQTIADFRGALGAAGSFQRLFEGFLLHLQQHGLGLAKAGVIVEATFVEVPRQRNTREENAQIKVGEIPPAFAQNAKLRAHKDTDARWVLKDRKAYYGDKNHCKVDVADKLILAAQVTAASVHDSRVFAALIQAGDGSVHADSAYKSAAAEANLAAQGVTAHLNTQGTKTRPLSEAQKAANRERSKVRCRVEHVFAQMRGSMHALWQRCIGIVRNTVGLQLANLVYNMLRFEQIARLNLTYAA